MSIAKRIKLARDKIGLSQSEAANTWGVNLHTLQGWEIGRHEPRGFARAQLDKLLAEILGDSAASATKSAAGGKRRAGRRRPA